VRPWILGTVITLALPTGRPALADEGAAVPIFGFEVEQLLEAGRFEPELTGESIPMAISAGAEVGLDFGRVRPMVGVRFLASMNERPVTMGEGYEATVNALELGPFLGIEVLASERFFGRVDVVPFWNILSASATGSGLTSHSARPDRPLGVACRVVGAARFGWFSVGPVVEGVSWSSRVEVHRVAALLVTTDQGEADFETQAVRVGVFLGATFGGQREPAEPGEDEEASRWSSASNDPGRTAPADCCSRRSN